jgi:hypothetical protein
MKTQKQIFEKASRIVRERGLKKGDYGTVDGPVCAEGALNEAARGSPDAFLFWLPEPARMLAQHTGIDIHTWSDRRSTTADEVADVLWLLGQIA